METNSFRLLLFGCALLFPAGTPAQGAGEPFLDWLQGPDQMLLAPRQRSPLPDKEREQFIKEARPLLKRLAENATEGLQGEALMTLAAVDPERSLPVVLAGLESEEPELLRSAILAAGLTGHNGVLLPLERLLAQADKQPGPARLAAISLGLLGPGLGSTTLHGQLRPALDRSQRALSQELLAMLAGLHLSGRRGDAAALVFVLEQSKIQEPQVFDLALWVASRLDPAAALKQVGLTLRREREASPATLACLAFPVERDKESVPHLVQVFARPNLPQAVHVQALLALGHRGGQESLQALQRIGPRVPPALVPFHTLARGMAGDKDKQFLQGCLEDLRKAADPARRAAAALAVGCASVAGEGPRLRHAFEAEKEPAVRGALALALAMLKEGAVRDLLAATFIETRAPFLRHATALALSALAAGAAPPDTILDRAAILATPVPWAPRLRWLGLFGGANSRRLLLDLSADAEVPVPLRVEALRALRVLGDPRREPALLALLLHEPLPVPVPALVEARRLAWGPPEGD